MKHSASMLLAAMLAATLTVVAPAAHAAPPACPTCEASADTHAAAMLTRMTLDEKLTLLLGRMPFLLPPSERPATLTLGAGYVPGIPRLGIPYLAQSDASLGVANLGGNQINAVTACLQQVYCALDTKILKIGKRSLAQYGLQATCEGSLTGTGCAGCCTKRETLG